MAYDIQIRYRCRALFEVLDMTLTEISKQESVPISTLSEWKNDGNPEYGGIWIKGSKSQKVGQAAEKLREELRATSVYDEMQRNIIEHQGVTKDGGLKADGVLDMASSNEALQAQVEADVTMLAAVGSDFFDAQMFKNAMLSSIVLKNQVKKGVDRIRQSDIKASTEILKMAKESRFGKSPDTVVIPLNGEHTQEELRSMSYEQLERIVKQQMAIDVDPETEHKEDA